MAAAAGSNRSQPSGVGETLVERERELDELRVALRAVRHGEGRTVVIEAPAGTGKSRLLDQAGELGRNTGMQVLTARGNELEQDFAFGIAIQLFEPREASAENGAWTKRFVGPAELARGLLETGASHDPAGTMEYSLIHGLFWLTSNLATSSSRRSTGTPHVILIDDVQWADSSSLRFLSYLAERVADIPIALVVTVRSGETSADSRALAALRHARTATRLEPSSLSAAGVETLVRTQFPDAETSFVEGCSRVTSGNPFLLVELLAQIHADGQSPDSTTVERIGRLAPEAIVNSVVARLGTLGPRARALASAVSVLGDGASLGHAARLAELTDEDAALAADALAAMNMFQPSVALSFVHPIIRSAVAASMSALALGQAHRRAAAILGNGGAPAEIVAAHLLAAPPQSEPGAVEDLRAAASTVLDRGARKSAVRLLERALAENPVPEVHADVLAELAHAEALAGLPAAAERLGEAIRVTEDPERRAELALAQSRSLYTQGRYRDAATALDLALTELAPSTEHSLAREVNAAYVSASSLVHELSEQAAPRRQRLLDGLADEPSAGERLALAHIAASDCMLGRSRASVRRLADLAWGNGALLDAKETESQGWQLLTAALLFSDELEREVEICDAALALARERHSPLLYATANYCRTWPIYEQSRISEAAGDAEAALGTQPLGWRTHFRPAYSALACCRLQQGQHEEVDPTLAMTENPAAGGVVRYAFLLELRAQLRLIQHRPQDALHDALLAAEQMQSESMIVNPAVVTWRSTAALAHLALGDARRARELAAEELELAESSGVTRLVIRNLRVLGLIAGGTEGIELLQQAVELAESSPPRLESVHAFVELGAALRRNNQRAAARAPLRRALELSHRGGAVALAERAQHELDATGARTRNVMRSGVDALTPSERRVGELAAQGLTTRQMGEALFVSPKTVEFHLRHIYQKLDINSRGELYTRLRNHHQA